MPIDRETAVRRLTNRYNEQCERFPTMQNDISLELWLSRNLAYVQKGDLLKQYEKA